MPLGDWFRLGHCGEVVLSPGPNEARSEIYTYGSLDISTHFSLRFAILARVLPFYPVFAVLACILPF